MNINEQAYIAASAHFLTKEFPADWQNMNESEILKYIDEHQWEHFDGVNPVEVWEHIENLANDFIFFAKKGKEHL